MSAIEPIFVNGSWVPSSSIGTFHAMNPEKRELLPAIYPISSWSDVELALQVAFETFEELCQMPSSVVADFLEAYAAGIESERESLVEIAHTETALAKAPRLNDVELPRTFNQLRAAAAAARSGSWRMPTIDTKANLRSCYQGIGPIAVFGPNNFPFAFGSVSGGDFAAAIAAGNPVIGKANSSHPGTTKRFMEIAEKAIRETGAPKGLVQLIYRLDHADGERLVSDHRIGATGYTGARSAGLVLKAAADRAGKPIYLELSSINPVIVLPGAIEERAAAIVDDYLNSGLAGTGQMCTNPGLVLLVDSPASREFVRAIVQRYESAPVGTLLSEGVQRSLENGIQILISCGAELLAGGGAADPRRCSVRNTILQTTGSLFLSNPDKMQTEVFGNAALFVLCSNVHEIEQVIRMLEGNLTGCIYSSTSGSEEDIVRHLSCLLVHKVGRLLNDKMPTGVAVSPAMNHGGPYPATGHPGFTAVGIPPAMLRFAKLTCYDHVRPHRLPDVLQDTPPTPSTWRQIDGVWKQGPLS